MSEQSVLKSPWLWGGCGCCLGIVVLPFVLAGLGVGGAFLALANLDVSDRALELIRADARVVERLGEPVESGWLFSGNIETSGTSGSADYSIPVSGPRGEGRAYIEAEKSAGDWTFESLIVEVDGERFTVVPAEGEWQSVPAPAEAPEDAEGAEPPGDPETDDGDDGDGGSEGDAGSAAR